MQELLGCMDLTSSMDWRRGAFEKNCTTLSTGDMYHTATKADSPDPAYSFLWHKYAPPKVRFFFAWLLLQDQIQSKRNLFSANIVDSATCEVCNEAPEDADHIISG